MKKLGFLVLPFMLLLSACATQPATNETLQQAQQAVSEAETNPAVARHAPVALRDAQQTLQQAQLAAREGADANDVEHLSYLAMRRAEIAQSLARRELLVRSAEDVRQQRAQVMLEERERAVQRAQQEAEQARQAAQEAQQQLAEFEPRQTERGLVLTLGEVLFPFDSANLQAGNQRAMDRLARYLQAHPDQEILIEGHTDSVGAAGYNQRLSEQRAESVYQALEQRGVDPSRVRVVGLGENYPVADNSTQSGRSQNRRVEVVIAQGETPRSRQEVQQAQRQSNQSGGQQQQQQPRG